MFGKVIKNTSKALGIFLVGLLLLFLTVFIAIQQESVQTWLVQKAASYLSEKTGTRISVGRVNIKFFRTLSIEDVFLEDKNQDTLAYIRNLDTKLSGFNPFESKFYFNTLTLEGVRANIYRPEDDSTFNYQFLIDALKGKPKSKKSSTNKKKSKIDLKVNQIHLADIRLVLDDKMKGQGHQVALKSLDISVNKLDFNKKIIALKSLDLVAPHYVLITYKHSEKKESNPFNVDIGWYIESSKLQISQGAFGMHDYTQERTYSKKGFEFAWFDVDSIGLQAQNFSWKQSIFLNLKNLSAKSEANHIHLHQLQGIAEVSNQHIRAKDLIAAYNDTKLEGNAQLQFNGFETFKDFVHQVHIHADINQIKTNGNDVAVWAQSARKYVPETYISGIFDGTVSNFTTKNFVLKAGKTISLYSDLRLQGIPDINQLQIDAQNISLHANAKEVKSLISYVKLPALIDQLGEVTATGSFKGKVKNFQANLDIHTDLGQLFARVGMQFQSGKAPRYLGEFSSKGIQLGKLLQVEKLGNTAFDLHVDGSGFNLAQLDSKVKGQINEIEYNYYPYKNITLDGTFSHKKFEGEMHANDECAFVDFNGLADFSNPEQPIYNFYTKITDADLQLLNLIPNRLIVSIEGNFEFKGKDINNLVGTADLSNISLKDNQINVNLSDLKIKLDKKDDYKEYTIDSKEINGYMKGYFDPIKLPASIQFYLSQHTSLLKAPGIEKLDQLSATQNLEMNIRISKDFGLFSLLDPKIKSFSDITIDGTYDNTASKINLNLNVDSLQYNKLHFNQFKTNIFDRNDSLIIISNLNSLETGIAKINHIKLGATTNLSGFYSRLRVENDTAKNNLDLITVVNFDGDSTKIRFPRSSIKVNNKIWSIDPSNHILILDTIFQLKNFTLQQGDQKITIGNRQSLANAFVKIEDLDIADLFQIVDSSQMIKSGRLNANLRLNNVLKSPDVDGDIDLKDFSILGETLDDINLSANLSDLEKKLNIQGKMIGKDYDVNIHGNYSLNKKNPNPLNLDVDFNKLSLKFLSFPFILGNEISNLHAYAKGKINVGGSFKNIALTGKATILDTASLKINFLGTTVRLANEDIVLKPKSIEFYKGGLLDNSITLLDNYNNKATIKAKLEHNNFKDFSVNASILTDKFNFLNTTYKDNQDYFGKVFASGTVDITGPFKNLNMNINATTLPNTVFNIVVAGSSDDQLYDFVKFTDRSLPKDTVEKIIENKIPSSINMEMNINATPDAQLKMYLDYAKNDVISAKGNGALQLQINPNGMQMFGDYIATSGNYLFSQQDIINKRFNIKNGSTISWSGNIMDAKMDVDAIYSSRVNMNDIVDSTSTLRNRRFPVDVVLNLGGTLANTDIKFSLEPSSNQSSIPDELQAVLDRINNDPAQINTQAFSLILFNRFLNLQGGNNNSQAGNIGMDMAVTTLSEFFNNKISEYVNDALSMILPGTEVAINQGTDNTGIKVTGKLNNDRLIINLGGDVQYGNKENLQLQENNTGFIGDVEIEYLITEDGRIRAKVYSRYDNTIVRLENESFLRSGIGITYQKEVDKFKYLFKFTRNNRRKQKSTETIAPEKDAIQLNHSVEMK